MADNTIGAARESWWTRTVNQFTAPARPQRPATGDRVSLSQARPDRQQIRQNAASRFFGDLRDAAMHPGRTVERLAQGGSKLLQGASDFVGQGVKAQVQTLGAVQGAVSRGGTRLVAGGLELAGAPQAAQRLRQAGDTAGRVIERRSAQVGDGLSSFVSGVGDGAGGLVEGVGTAVAHPVQTLQGLQKLEQVINPVSQLRAMVVEGKSPTEVYRENLGTVTGMVDGFKEGYRQTGQDHGTAGQVGRAFFDVVTTVATGGESAAGRVSLRAGANLMDDFARASRAAGAGGEAANVGRLAKTTGEFVANRLPAPLAERLTGAAESGTAALVRRSERLEAQNLARGQQKVAQTGADGAAVLNPARQRAGALSNQLRNNEQKFLAGSAERDALLQELPAPAQQRVRELASAGRDQEALELLQRHHVDDAIRSSLDEAGRVDELYPAQLPAGVDPSRVLAQGRRGSLEYMLNDASLGADALRRNFRHIVGDSDITGPVFIQEFKAGDQVGRAFSSSAGRETGIGSTSAMEGGYFGSVDDVNRSRSQIQQRNAVGLSNHADRFATYTLEQDTYGVVSRIGEQFSHYGEHAVGGGMQYTFPGAKPANPVVTDVGRLSRPLQTGLNTVAGTSLAGQMGNPDE
jgi:hypothetical protein